MKYFTSLLTIFVAINTSWALDAFPPDYQKRRVIVTSDIGGGDQDDIQSMIHFLVYANMFDLEGIVISRPRGNIDGMKEVIKAYAKDYDKLSFISSDYPTPAYLKQITKVGAKRNQKSPREGYSKSTSGSRLIVNAAKRDDPRPIYIMNWGSITDTAQAIHDTPKELLHKYYIISGGSIADGVSGYNEKLDPSPYEYMRKIKNKRFIWLESHWTGGGIYTAGIRSKKHYGNVGFVKEVIRPRGALGRHFYKNSDRININKYGIKMGDSAQVLFVFNGNFEDPYQESWGGRFCKVAKNYYQECDGDIRDGSYNDYNKIVDKHRLDFLKDWEQRLIYIYDR